MHMWMMFLSPVSATQEEHLHHIWNVLECFSSHGIEVYPNKCDFGGSDIIFLATTSVSTVFLYLWTRFTFCYPWLPITQDRLTAPTVYRPRKLLPHFLVLTLNAHLKKESSVGKLTRKLAEDAVFGPDVMKVSAPFETKIYAALCPQTF